MVSRRNFRESADNDRRPTACCVAEAIGAPTPATFQTREPIGPGATTFCLCAHDDLGHRETEHLFDYGHPAARAGTPGCRQCRQVSTGRPDGGLRKGGYNPDFIVID